MRITQAMMLNTALEAEATDSSRMAQLTTQASSGLAVSEPSDDPATWASIQDNQAEMGIIQARSTAASRAAGDLNLAESTLDSAGNLVTQAQSLAVEGANGTEDASSRADLATQVNSILQQLVALANTKGSTGQYLFGGTNTNTPPVDSSGNYQGNNDVTQVQIADGVTAVSNADGASAFSTLNGGRDVFADLQSLATALSSNDTAGIQSSIDNLQTSNAQLVSARVSTGLSASRLSSASSAMSSALTQMQTNQANMQDADAPSTLSNLQAAQTAYEAALQVNRQVLSVSLSNTSMG